MMLRPRALGLVRRMVSLAGPRTPWRRPPRSRQAPHAGHGRTERDPHPQDPRLGPPDVDDAGRTRVRVENRKLTHLHRLRDSAPPPVTSPEVEEIASGRFEMNTAARYA